MSASAIPTPPPLPAVRKRRLAWAGIALAALGLVYIYFNDPTKSAVGPTCVFHDVTGFYCPGCGGTRAMHALLHGHLLTAIAFNPLIVVTVPLGISLLLRAALWPVETRRRVMAPAWIWTIFVLLVTFWITRNIPVYPFTLLAP